MTIYIFPIVHDFTNKINTGEKRVTDDPNNLVESIRNILSKKDSMETQSSDDSKPNDPVSSTEKVEEPLESNNSEPIEENLNNESESKEASKEKV